MFQYAAGRALAVKYRVPLMLDIASYEPKQAGMFALNGLAVQAGIAEAHDLELFQQGLIGKVLSRLRPPHKRRVYKEPHFHFDPGFFYTKPPLYLKGYWQSWRYFEPVADIIRKDFTFAQHFSAAVQEKAWQLKGSESVAIHFRRGDYTSKEAVEYHGITGADYYQQAVARFRDAKFYVFTNDPAWVRENLPTGIDYEILSGGLSHTPYEDLFLMSQCRHQIIANSSFSWWGAWLNEYAGKQVISPTQWFATGQLDAMDLIPASWYRI